MTWSASRRSGESLQYLNTLEGVDLLHLGPVGLGVLDMPVSALLKQRSQQSILQWLAKQPS